MFGSTNDTLLIEAENLVPLGPWQVWFFWSHGLVPRPTVKKNRLSILLGTLAGYWALARLNSFFVKLVAKEVSFRGGSDGMKIGSFCMDFNVDS